MYILRTIIAAATIGAIACTVAAAEPATVQVKLYAQNRPGETGTVTLEQIPAGVTVHIHAGTCATPDPAPKYALTNIVHGTSTTTIPGVTLGDLLKGQYVIDVHESSADIAKYVACAPIAMSQ
jgi:hypothetical protein